jgi:hypothetical protein
LILSPFCKLNNLVLLLPLPRTTTAQSSLAVFLFSAAHTLRPHTHRYFPRPRATPSVESHPHPHPHTPTPTTTDPQIIPAKPPREEVPEARILRSPEFSADFQTAGRGRGRRAAAERSVARVHIQQDSCPEPEPEPEPRSNLVHPASSTTSLSFLIPARSFVAPRPDLTLQPPTASQPSPARPLCPTVAPCRRTPIHPSIYWAHAAEYSPDGWLLARCGYLDTTKAAQ